MSILIKGMEMPKDCRFCPLYANYACRMTGYTPDIPIRTRGEDCPLVELPPHGRLIDADDLADVFSECHDDWVKEQVAIAPTIIEAEVDDGTG